MVKVISSEGSRNWANQLDDTFERWRLRKSVGSKIKGSRITKMSAKEFSRFISGKSKDDLLLLSEQLSDISRDIRRQLSRNHSQGNVKNQWVHDANTVRRIAGGRVQSINAELAKIKKRNHTFLSKTFEYRFVENARRILDDETFSKIRNLSLDELNSKQI